jgi:hypothetical protein
MGWPKVAKTKTPQAFWRPAAICLVKVLSQSQVRANRAKPIKEILAAGCVVYLRTVHKTKVTGPDPLSSLVVVPAGEGAQFDTTTKVGRRWEAPHRIGNSLSSPHG